MNKVEKITTNILNSIVGILIFIVSFAAFYLPYEIRIIPVVEYYLTPVRLVCGGLLIISFLFLFISRLRVFRDNWYLFANAIFVGILIFTTKMNQGHMESVLGTYGLAGVFLVMTVAVFFKVNPKKYILIAFFLLLAVNIANTYTVYHFWGIGMWEVYGQYRNMFYSLIGNYNGGIEYVIPMAICGSAYAHKYGKWMEFINYPAMIMSLMMSIKCDSATQMMVYAAILAFMVIGDIAMLSKGFAKVVRYICQPIVLWAFNIAAFLSVIVLNKTDWVAKLGIDPNFHNRRHIWNMSMDWISQKPLWGNGQETIAVEASKIKGYAHSHCTYLEVAYKTGFVGSVFMFLMLLSAAISIYRNKNHRLAFMMSGMLFLTGTAMLVETYPLVTIMICFGLVYYVCKNTAEVSVSEKKVKKVKGDAVEIESADLKVPVDDSGKAADQNYSVSEEAVNDTEAQIIENIKEETQRIMEEEKTSNAELSE